MEELKGEKIDIIRWSEDPVEYIAAALSPADVVSVEELTGSLLHAAGNFPALFRFGHSGLQGLLGGLSLGLGNQSGPFPL